MCTRILFVVFALVVACGDDDLPERSEGTMPGDCTDRADNDGDGDFDCDDNGCAGSPDCRGEDGGVDAGNDGGVDVDGGNDAGSDSGNDAGSDGGTDANIGGTCALPSGVGCGTGAWCLANRDMEGVGTCVMAGAGGHGDACTGQSECAESVVCTLEGVCRALCEVATAGEDCAATASDLCLSLASTEPFACEQSCTTFGNDPACPAGEWCRGGLCAPTGPGEEGAACGRGSPLCGFGLGCRANVCTPLCSDSPPGGVGDICEPEEVCIGVCAPSCDYDGAANCPDSEACIPEEYTGVADYCAPVPNLPEGADCAAAGLELGAECGAFANCNGTDNVCIDLCRPDVAPFGTVAHPDCRDALKTCTEAVAGLSYGFCT